VTKRFYLTGGTALAEFYLRHRLSEDLDLFSEESEVDPKLVDAFLLKISPKLGIKKIKRSQFLGLVSHLLTYKDGETLKVDFNYYPFPRINKGKKYKGLKIDSVYDIAVNKLHTLFMRPRARDYIDLYFIMIKETYPLEKLIIDAKAKFDWDIDRVNLASQFTRVRDFKDNYPKMLVPFDHKEMEAFFLSQAKKLEKEIFKS
jgi:predicted nucleotidyltransferase component of viral defense system